MSLYGDRKPNSLLTIIWLFSVTDKETYISKIMQQNFIRMVDSARPLLLSYGFFDETVDRWIANTREEVQNMKHRYYVRVSCFDLIRCSFLKHYIVFQWLFEWAIKPRQAN